MRRRGAVAGLTLALVALAGAADGQAILDYITFDGIDYIRFAEEPGRPITLDDLGPEFATVECSFGEDRRGCPYGVDAGAAYLPAGTRVHAVRGHGTSFRLAAIWRDRVFLYQAWRNPRAKAGSDIYAIGGKVRAIDVRRGEPTVFDTERGVPVGSDDVAALVELILRGAARRPSPHPLAEPRYWLTFWLTDGTTLGRAYYADTSEMMGGVVVPPELRRLLERALGD
ncbi:MAG TPA: hypothetical protein VJU81_12785 [Methylomirabilota bacterium]|nr:hypothetical protein [Methylomirabilota bacterium]